MSVYIEAYIPVVLEQGLKTQKAVSFESTLAVTGAATFASTVAITGALTLSASVVGARHPVTASGGTTRTLTAANSGSVNLFDSAAGITYTLPAPVVGLYYDFYTSVLQTSSAHVVVTDAGTTFLSGSIAMFSGEDVTPSSTLGPKMYAANGSTHIKYTSNGTTTGGGIGTAMRFTCIAATIWFVTGIVKSPSGSLATPFST